MTSARRELRAAKEAAGPPATAWVKSSHSGPTGGNCVEAAAAGGRRVAVRDSRQPSGPVLVFPAGEWAAFLSGAKDGMFG